MNYIGKVLNNCKYIYNEINAATLTGAIDVIVVEQPDGTYTCSPFHVRFGKLGVLRSKEKIVDIEINGEPVDIHMKLGESGEAFFVEEVECGDGEEEPIPPHLACSPIPPDHGFPSDWPSFDDGPHDETRLDDDGLALQSGGTMGPASTPKTFRAETLGTDEAAREEAVRKLSTSSRIGDFRPITGQASETSLSSHDSTNEFIKEDSPSADERGLITGGNTSSNNNNGKRKKRKKSTKKKNQKRAINAAACLEEKNSSNAIFQMEDIDGEEVVLPSKRNEESLSTAIDVPQQPTDRDIHFFSDTDITPGSSPRDNHEFAPVQSDTEFETSKRTIGSDGNSNAKNDDQPQSWRWGELPTSNTEDNKQESQKWMLQNMLGFMKKTKHIRHKSNEGNEGIYLSDLNSDDPEMAALYLSKAYRQSNSTNEYVPEEGHEEDAESGNGPSLPQSPHSVEGAICGPKSLENDFEKWYRDDMALSLCGLDATSEQFTEHIVSHSELSTDPVNLINNPKLVVKIDGKIYSWKVAAPMLLSMVVFHKPLPQESVEKLGGPNDNDGIKEDRIKEQKKSSTSYSWFNWSRAAEQQPDIGSKDAKPIESPTTEALPTDKTDSISNVIETEKVEKVVSAAVDVKPKRPDSMDLHTHEQDVPLDLSPQNRNISGSLSKTEEDRSLDHSNADKYRKTLRLSSEQIAQLKLLPGANEVEFSVTTAYQGTSRCKCFLFCWRYDDKIVVSDIDGTITKSDVLGHILPIVGKDWAQSGVAKLFTKIKENGYKLLYLSARAIGQSRVTRDYLKSIKQEEMRLPEGPMLLNPTSLLNAFHTEVIEKKPEEFKISCLKDIQALFPSHIKPFYAGYGNKINDVWAYQAVGIPIFRIFTINHRGELKHELTQTFQSTYFGQSRIANDLFPPLNTSDEDSDGNYTMYNRNRADTL